MTTDLSRRYFARLSDEQLLRIFRERSLAWTPNASRANREVRRRAAKAGMASPYEWLSVSARKFATTT